MVPARPADNSNYYQEKQANICGVFYASGTRFRRGAHRRREASGPGLDRVIRTSKIHGLDKELLEALPVQNDCRARGPEERLGADERLKHGGIKTAEHQSLRPCRPNAICRLAFSPALEHSMASLHVQSGTATI